jgi:type IV fimbrial biogenesis protein FimT
MNKQNGFSMIEVIVTMAIAAILLSIAVPSYQTAVQNNRRTTSTNELATAFQLARNTAISQRVTVTVCKSNTITAATPTCSTGGDSGDWSQGWIIFTDADESLSINGTDTLLRVHEALPGTTSFTGGGNAVNRVSFSPQGLTRNNDTITHCDSRGAADASALIISVGGQVRHARDTNNDGIVDDGIIDNDPDGDNVTCPT